MTDIVPNMLYILWKGGSHISFAGCLAQFQVYGESLCIVSILLTVMSYDRYLAICKPLHYFSIMDAKLQSRLASLTWLSSFIMTLFIIIQMSLLESCRDNVIDHYFCDFDPFVGLSCTDAYILKMQVIIISGVLVVPTFMFIIVTYLYIGLTIFKINFNSGRQKAFYTCSSHLTVVCIHYGSLMAIYLSSTNGQSFNIKKFLSLLNTFCTPLLNPLIFSLRNMEIKKALLQLLDGVKNPNVPLSHRVNSVVGVGAFNKRKM
ncbi:putative olfactory receptor 2W6 [Pseudophryne corroboree]|uniref:putative olfactory receptor 2W6 n=1 Tax=Pseudophryne corroboree TaxID=495146 RepID=UPI0030821CD6